MPIDDKELKEIISMVVRQTIAHLAHEKKLSDQFLTVEEVSKRLGLSRKFVYNNKKSLGCVYLFGKGKPLFRMSVIERLLKDEKAMPEKFNFQKVKTSQ
ncbi:MAG: helix-turn-helix domain-containing protein [Thermodesulfovibrionales bacterium]|nr:helix-turn-helix domain-containing protein [Thermodesulfovibrionales bacterium]